jgi:hypothetical protein
MGGDFIGSILTTESSGIDTLRLIIDIALNRRTLIKEFHAISVVDEVKVEFNICESRIEELKYAGYGILHFEDIQNYTKHNKEITSSAERHNYIIYKRPQWKQ